MCRLQTGAGDPGDAGGGPKQFASILSTDSELFPGSTTDDSLPELRGQLQGGARIDDLWGGYPNAVGFADDFGDSWSGAHARTGSDGDDHGVSCARRCQT